MAKEGKIRALAQTTAKRSAAAPDVPPGGCIDRDRACRAQHGATAALACRLFYKFRSWQKVVVMSGGPMVNIAIAFFLFWGVFATVGQVVDAKVEPVVAEVVPCIVPYAEDGRGDRSKRLLDLVMLLLRARTPVTYREVREQFRTLHRREGAHPGADRMHARR